MNEHTPVGIDLAKEVFAICVLDAQGVPIERKLSSCDAPSGNKAGCRDAVCFSRAIASSTQCTRTNR